MLCYKSFKSNWLLCITFKKEKEKRVRRWAMRTKFTHLRNNPLRGITYLYAYVAVHFLRHGARNNKSSICRLARQLQLQG